MDSEDTFAEQHETPERFPSKEEIRSVFETILQGKRYKELRVLSKEGLVRLYEIEVTLENGERLQYNYQRAIYNYRDKSLPPGAQFSASIHMTKYGSEGNPNGGHCVANYLDGEWKYYK
jgi:hypothetical protein